MCERNYKEESDAEKISRLERTLKNYRDLVHANAGGIIDLKNRFFTVQENIFILDNSFDFDAGLKVSGDFIDDQKKEYAHMIANALNNYNQLQKENEEMKKLLADLKSHSANLPKEIAELVSYLK